MLHGRVLVTATLKALPFHVFPANPVAPVVFLHSFFSKYSTSNKALNHFFDFLITPNSFYHN